MGPEDERHDDPETFEQSPVRQVTHPDVLPTLHVARHGETAWTVSGQRTGLTDLPLTERGERDAHRLGERLQGLSFAQVFTSPLQRAANLTSLFATFYNHAIPFDRSLLRESWGRCDGPVGRRGRTCRTRT